MPKSGLTGGRIRQTRLSKGLKQAELAARVGISASYLNLIEHNRRTIGGKILVNLALEMGVETSLLSRGAQPELLEVLGAASTSEPDHNCEIDRIEEFISLFPGWARLIATHQDKIERLERSIELLSDRLGHDPQLAETMHEMLSVVTSIRSTASILGETSGIEPEWQVRFLRNLSEDSKRLAENSQSLVAYLDETDNGNSISDPTLPKEELENWLADRQFHVAQLEGQPSVSVGDLLKSEERLRSSPVILSHADNYLRRYRDDAEIAPLSELSDKIRCRDFDPLEFSNELGCDLATVLRRISCLPNTDEFQSGLVVCDGSGTITFSKPVNGFTLPRFGSACPIWPLYRSLSQPMVPIRCKVVQSGFDGASFLTYAISMPIRPIEFSSVPLFEATMLILPEENSDGRAHQVGSSCRVCPRKTCRSRREPSIQTVGF